MADLAERLAQLLDLVAAIAEQRPLPPVWMGGFFSPGAFITATRQAVAARRECSLEDLALRVRVGDKEQLQGEEDTFVITRTWREGALRVPAASKASAPGLTTLPPMQRPCWRALPGSRTVSR